jgi:hypothetical protein
MSIGAHVEAGGVTAPRTYHPTAPAVALTYTDGTSALLEFVGNDNSTNQVLTWDPPPAGYSLATPGRFTDACQKNNTGTDGPVTINQRKRPKTRLIGRKPVLSAPE